MQKFESAPKVTWGLLAVAAFMVGISISVRIAEYQDRIAAAEEVEIQELLTAVGCGKKSKPATFRAFTAVHDGSDCGVVDYIIRSNYHNQKYSSYIISY